MKKHAIIIVDSLIWPAMHNLITRNKPQYGLNHGFRFIENFQSPQNSSIRYIHEL
jgi:hypothetical protein